jgi:hypothetical protein
MTDQICKRRRTSASIVLALGVLFALGLSRPAAAQMFVLNAHHDPGASQLVIRGGTFSAGVRVFFGLTELPVTSVGASEIRASLTSPEPGSHLLIVFQPPSAVATFVVSVGTESTVMILRDDFEQNALPPTDWAIDVVGGAAFFLPPTTFGTLDFGTQVAPFTPGSVTLRGLRSFSLDSGTLIFTTRVMDAYVDQGIYGDAQPRGLAAGGDRSNAIEFVNAFPTPTTVACRTVAAGAVTQTTVDIGQSVRTPAVYQIVARPTEVKFYVNGTLKCTHTTNIPSTVPLNPYFGTGDSGAGNVPVVIDWVTFERRVR